MVTIDGPFLCQYCTRLRLTTYRGGEPVFDPRCDAFVDGIPAAIIDNRADHRKPVPGDNGIQFDLVPSSAESFERALPRMFGPKR